MNIILRNSMPHLVCRTADQDCGRSRRKSLKLCSLGAVNARVSSFDQRTKMDNLSPSLSSSLASQAGFGSVKSLIHIFNAKCFQSTENIELESNNLILRQVSTEDENDCSRSSVDSEKYVPVRRRVKSESSTEIGIEHLKTFPSALDVRYESIVLDEISGTSPKFKQIRNFCFGTEVQTEEPSQVNAIANDGSETANTRNSLQEKMKNVDTDFFFEDEYEKSIEADQSSIIYNNNEDDKSSKTISFKESSFQCDNIRTNIPEELMKSSSNIEVSSSENDVEDVQCEEQDDFTDYDKINDGKCGDEVSISNLSGSQAMGRNSWRTKGIRRKKIDMDDCEPATSTIVNLKKQALYQTLTVEEDNHLRNSIRTASDSEALGMYLLCRNGNQMTIHLVGQHLSQHPSLGIDTGPIKTLWQNLPEVTSSGILDNMSKQKIQLQEALFEIFSTEASYVHSLGVLEEHFMSKISSIINSKQYRDLFAPMEPFITSARTFLGEIINLWAKDVKLCTLCKLVKKYYEANRESFIKYAKNLETMLKNTRKLTEDIPEFKDLLNELQDSVVTNRLSLDSFMNLPLQRLTRMPLLLKSVIAKAGQKSEFYFQYISAIGVVEKVCNDCNNEITRLKRIEEMLKLSSELDFDKSIRFMQGDLRFLVHRASGRRAKTKRPKLEILLFNDLFLVATKKQIKHHSTEDKLHVITYCPRAALRVNIWNQERKCVDFELLSNGEGKKEVLPFEFDLLSDFKRWMEALEVDGSGRHQQSDGSPHEYDEGEAQAVVIEKYTAHRQDELNLDIGDIVNIIGGDIEGWYQGAKLKDGTKGWFRATCCDLIKSDGLRRFNVNLRRQLRDHARNSHISLASMADPSESLV